MAETVKIGDREYEIDGAVLVAEKYDDGTELVVTCTSGQEPTRARFIRRGPRGGGTHVVLGGSLAECEEDALRLMDARRHIKIVDAYRRERWGLEPSS
jgi:hypothetical protein